MPALPGIYYQPPPVFTGGKQPYTQRQLAVQLLGTQPSNCNGQMWGVFPDKDPGVYTRYQRTRLRNPATLSITPGNPPFEHEGRWVGVVHPILASQPPPPPPFMGGRQPLRRRTLHPTVMNLVPANPRFGHPMRSRAVQQRVVALSTPPTNGAQRPRPVAAISYVPPPPPVPTPADVLRSPFQAQGGLRSPLRSPFVPLRYEGGIDGHA